MAATDNPIQQLYVAFLGRPGDPGGLAYWTSVFNSGGSLASIAAAFSQSAEATSLNAGLTTVQIVTATYQRLFGRDPEPAGLAYFSLNYDRGVFSLASLALNIMQGAQGADLTVVSNKVAAANAFTASLDTLEKIIAYQGRAAADAGKTLLGGVTGTTDVSAANLAKLDAATLAKLLPTAPAPAPDPDPGPAPSTFTTSVAAQVLSFGGTATGDITVAWAGAVVGSVATFTRGGLSAAPALSFGDSGPLRITVAADQAIAGNAAQLIGLQVLGTGSVKLTDTAAHLAGKFFNAASTTNDVLTVTDAPSTNTFLTALTNFETVHLAGSTATIYIADGAGVTGDSSAAVQVQLGTGGQTFTGSAGNDTVAGSSGNDTISGGGGTNTLTGGTGNDTFKTAAGAIDTITDLGINDIVVVAATGTVTTTANVAAFSAAATTVNNGSATINSAAAGSTINVSQATGTNGFTLVGGAGTDTLTGSAQGDTITGGAGADALAGGAGADTFVYTVHTDSTANSHDTISDFAAIDFIKTGVTGGATSVNQGVAYTATGTGNMVNAITTAVAVGNAAGVGHVAAANDVYVVTITANGAGTYVFQDTNGNGAVDGTELVIQLTGTSITTLAAGNFIA